MSNFHDHATPVQVIITVWVREGATVQEVINEMDYRFEHDDIVDAEVQDFGLIN